MRRVKKLIMILCNLAIILAISVPVCAIDFDAEEIYSSIFVIESGNSLGSGFAIGENCIITNAHVISNEGSISVTTYSGESFSAEIYCIDSNLDIAVLYTCEAEPLVPLQSCYDISVGDEVYAIGAPNSMAYTLTKGIISSKEREINAQSYIQTDAAINSGNSGGPLINNSGQVIGVNSYKMSNSEGIGLAIPIKTVISYLNNNNIETGELGIVNGKVEKQSEMDKDNTDTNNDAGYTDNANDTDNTQTIEENNNHISVKDMILFVSLGISIAANIVLVIVLVFQKKKNIDMKIDPSERTDFDIEILE